MKILKRLSRNYYAKPSLVLAGDGGFFRAIQKLLLINAYIKGWLTSFLANGG